MFVYLFPLVKVYTKTDDQGKMEATINKIKEIIPKDKETRNYVGMKLAQLAQTLMKGSSYYLAKQLSLEAYEISKDNPLLKGLYEDAYARDSLERDLHYIYEDPNLPQQLKDLCNFIYDKSTSGEDRDTWQTKVLSSLNEVSRGDLLKGIYTIKRDYKHIYETNTDFFEYYISAELGGDGETVKSMKDYCKKCGNNATQSYLTSHKGLCPMCYKETIER